MFLASGVLFTHELDTEAPYYVINYDDKTQKTDTITSAKMKYQQKVNSLEVNKITKIKRFIKLMYATSDLEKKIKNDFLDRNCS